MHTVLSEIYMTVYMEMISDITNYRIINKGQNNVYLTHLLAQQ